MKMQESGRQHLNHGEQNPAALGRDSKNATGAAQCQIWVYGAVNMWQATKSSADHVSEGHTQQVLQDVLFWKDLQEGQ